MPLQKSFSEQHRFSRRPQWQKSKSYSGTGPSLDAQHRQPAPAPPVPVSEKTKNKLHQFQFLPQAPAPQALAERVGDAGNAQESPLGPVSREGDVDGTNKENRAGSVASDVRVSDGSKLDSWQDFLGETHPPREEDEDVSPADRILWRHDHNAIASTIIPMISRKRARSSSPLSSSSPSSSSRSKRHQQQPATPSVNVKKLSAALKTPRADPALELWDRYAIPAAAAATAAADDQAASPLGPRGGNHNNYRNNNHNNNNTTTATITANNNNQHHHPPSLAHLMISSSPRVPDKNGGGSLRRSFSCGTHWPKRRKIERPGQLSSVNSQGSPRGHSKASMLSELLVAVTGEIKKSDAAVAAAAAAEEPTSPARNRGTPSGSPARVSDYGDDDLDDDTLLELDAHLPTFQDDEETTFLAETEDHVQEDHRPDDHQDQPAVAKRAAEAEGTLPQEESRREAPPAANSDDDDPYGDAFGQDFDFDAAELAATQQMAKAPRPSPSLSSQVSVLAQPSPKPKTIQRHLVTNVLESSYLDERGAERPEKILLVQAERSKGIKTIHLRGDWYDTPVSTKSFVHVVGDFEAGGRRCVVDNAQNMLILHPDQLISSTVVADSFSCMRRAVLQDRVKASSTPSEALVYGTLLHEIFQEALAANRWDPAFVGAVVGRLLRKHVEDLYVVGVGVAAARDHLLSKMPELRRWAETFVAPDPRPDAVVQGRHGERLTMCVSKLLDVEEHVWSPTYGLKGNIDATVQVTMRECGTAAGTAGAGTAGAGASAGTATRTLTVPFEVKSGRNASTSHQAQTALYSLLLSDRYDIDVAYGILYYMETSQTLRVPSIRHELRHMIMQRNRLACHARERGVRLPPMKRTPNVCGRCFAQASCFVYHKLADGGDGQTSGMGAAFDDVVGHLTPTHRDFFLRWEDLLTREEKESQKLRRELWTMTGAEREKLGRCLAGVVIREGSLVEDLDKPKVFRFEYTFVKAAATATESAAAATSSSFLDSQLTTGEPIVVSDEQGHFALALGYVTTVRKRSITVAVDRRLHNARIRQAGFDEVDNQVFAGIMEVGAKQKQHQQQHQHQSEPPVRYRLDKDEFSSGMAAVRNNLVQSMVQGPAAAAQIRRLVIDLEPPRFQEAAAATQQYAVAEDGDGDGDGRGGGGALNVDQRRAIDKVMSAADYALVLGMPGTGKTTTIAHIIRALVSQGKSVLLTSYTHTAVDNILLKLRADGYPILRLGAAAKVHPEVREFAILDGGGGGQGRQQQQQQQPKATSFEEIERAWFGTPVVATTCLGIQHALFQRRTFDYCIVDEASQITLPVCLGPIRMARTFVLVGDHNQLPPLVQSDEARAGGLDVSLFRLLSERHPQAVARLEHQYRMCEDVMALSNTLIYRGRLRCGTEALRTAKLRVPDMAALSRCHHLDADTFLSPSWVPNSSSVAASTWQTTRRSSSSLCPGPRPGACWLRDLVEPEARVRFVNTDGVRDSREEAQGSRIVNRCEARLVAQMVEALLAVGVPASEIGVMTPYRSQLALLRHQLRGRDAAGGGEAIEMHTADRFQGRDKEVVVLSLVRSNEACSIGELLRDWRRINVAFTRAKTKLLVVGSRATLRGRQKQQEEQQQEEGEKEEEKGDATIDGKSSDNAGNDEEDGNMLARFVALMEERDWVYDLPADALESHRFEHFVSQDGSSGAARSPRKTRADGGDGHEGGGEQKAAPTKAGPDALAVGGGKENSRPAGPKKARVGSKVLLKGRPILRDVLNEMMDGTY